MVSTTFRLHVRVFGLHLLDGACPPVPWICSVLLLCRSRPVPSVCLVHHLPRLPDPVRRDLVGTLPIQQHCYLPQHVLPGPSPWCRFRSHRPPTRPQGPRQPSRPHALFVWDPRGRSYVLVRRAFAPRKQVQFALVLLASRWTTTTKLCRRAVACRLRGSRTDTDEKEGTEPAGRGRKGRSPRRMGDRMAGPGEPTGREPRRVRDWRRKRPTSIVQIRCKRDNERRGDPARVQLGNVPIFWNAKPRL